MRTENDRLITLNDECRLLGEEENELKDLIDQSKMQLTQVTKGIRHDVICATLIKLVFLCRIYAYNLFL